MRTQLTLNNISLRLAVSGILAMSISLYSSANTPVSRIELVEALEPLIPLEKQMAGNFTDQYTDIKTITPTQRLILNGYLAQTQKKSGTSAHLFSPTMSTTRAQAAVMIHRMVSAANPKWASAITESKPVLDATTVAWAQASITDLVNAGVIETTGPGYVFPKRAVSLETAKQWVESASVFIPKPEPIRVTEKSPAPMPVVANTERTTSNKHKPQSDELHWQVRVYGGLSLGQSPYQSNQPPAEVAEERYQVAESATLNLQTTGSGSPKNKRLYGLESGIEFSRKVIKKPIWLVAGYGYGIVKETMPATTITMPVVFYELLKYMSNPPKYSYVDSAEDGRLEIFNLGEHVVRKTTHTIRLGLQHAFYKTTMQKAHIECYWGGGLAISTSAIWGSVLELPQQNINEIAVLFEDRGPREDYITREKVRSFYHTQTQASAYGELGGLASRNSMHVGVQARFQLNPGELSVDEKGNKRLTREITSLATLFVGIRF